MSQIERMKRNLEPHAEARMAMWILSEREKEICKTCVDQIKAEEKRA